MYNDPPTSVQLLVSSNTHDFDGKFMYGLSFIDMAMLKVKQIRSTGNGRFAQAKNIQPKIKFKLVIVSDMHRDL